MATKRKVQLSTTKKITRREFVANQAARIIYLEQQWFLAKNDADVLEDALKSTLAATGIGIRFAGLSPERSERLKKEGFK